MFQSKAAAEVCDSFGPKRSVSSLFADYGFTDVNQSTSHNSKPDRDEYLLSGGKLLELIQHQARDRDVKENLQLLELLGMVCVPSKEEYQSFVEQELTTQSLDGRLSKRLKFPSAQQGLMK